MTNDHAALRDCLSDVRAMRPTSEEVDAVLARADTRRSSRRPSLSGKGRTTIRVSALAAVVVAVFAVPQVRGAVDDVANNFAGYFDGDESRPQPGEPLGSEGVGSDVPAWITEGGSEPRVLAREGSHALFISRADEQVVFSLDSAMGVGESPSVWTARFEAKPLYVLGALPILKGEADQPLFGVVSANVKTVEIQYREGGSAQADARTGGFIVLVDPSRRPNTLEALDGNGDRVFSQPVPPLP